MPEPKLTVTSLATSMERQLNDLRSECQSLRREIDRADLVDVAKRLAVIEQRLNDLGPTREEARRVAALEERVSQLTQAKEEADRRAWQFIVLFVGGLLTLAVNLVVSFLKK